ncbi:sigma-70 family RNA polymerase sigma factor [Saccharibacillus alkalitolerans]|uniref:Sigma-70 family RNA polymerase sigma factor n=1 Tax=Saccharibacillus alkalitolerans TaxID=2705290 RepID=A0ABX0F529_9BACL|nr:sigma-70 family RNA polymerase sigma factor [Saccharibacillus alkalitolerans]NGZ74718.1 sigma-70 family RNA polymerase sigma factor [Saccharibacillus alkalitolerans]
MRTETGREETRAPDIPGTEDSDDIGRLYRRYRKYAFAIAYRMLGSAADAEDIVQDVFAELSRRMPAMPDHPKSDIARSAVNRSLNLLNSARGRRERYVGDWLPEPVGEAALGPEESAVRGDALSFAYMVMLERLTPAERAVFVLREAFGFGYDEIAGMVGRSESALRQNLSRAKRKLKPAEGETRLAPIQAEEETAKERTELLRRFERAFAAYDIDGVLNLLGDRPVLTADGGGARIRTIVRPMEGRKGVCALLTSRRIFKEARSWAASVESVNGEPQLVYREGGEARMAIMPYTEPDSALIDRIYVVIGPEKLGRI